MIRAGLIHDIRRRCAAGRTLLGVPRLPRALQEKDAKLTRITQLQQSRKELDAQVSAQRKGKETGMFA